MQGQKIVELFNLKKQIDDLQTQADKLNKEIKLSMKEEQLATFKEGDIVATYAIQERNSMNDVKLLQTLKDLNLMNAIKQIEIPNNEVIEDLIYNGDLDPTILQDCTIVKQVEVLKVQKKKGSK